jgi:CheY-like chemotaxis protein
MTVSKVLIVDDDSLVREIGRTLLEPEGYEVWEAGDGEAALALLETQAIDIALLDIMMPHKEGLETLVEMKQRFPGVIVIAMSASGARRGHDFLSTAAKFGADGTLQKPFTPEQLLASLNSGSVCDGLSGMLNRQLGGRKG